MRAVQDRDLDALNRLTGFIERTDPPTIAEKPLDDEDLSHIHPDVRAQLRRESERDALPMTRREFEAGRRPRFGRTNPERMNPRFWLASIRFPVSAGRATRRWFTPAYGFVHPESGWDPIWRADRMGQSLTRLPDGRLIEVGGEHEDSYMPDFCIYNDVFVHHPDGRLEIYGYPPDVFPPTDFHTATRIGDGLYIIGGIGYQGARQFGHTPVLRLDLNTYAIERIATHGENPGWIYKHRTRRIDDATLEVTGGKVCDDASYENPDAFRLDVATALWTRIRA